MFLLKHLVHVAKQIKPKGCSHLHTAFIDFKQAYAWHYWQTPPLESFK